jgi:hypothetical protein
MRGAATQAGPGSALALDPAFRHDDTSLESEAGWCQAKLRYPVGSTVAAQVTQVFPSNHECWIRFAGDDRQRWSGALLSWTSVQPVVRSTGQYRVVAHLDTTRRIMAVPVR